MGPRERVLIDSFLRLSFLIITCSQGRMYLSRHPPPRPLLAPPFPPRRPSPLPLPPMSVFPRREGRACGSESPKSRPGRRIEAGEGLWGFFFWSLSLNIMWLLCSFNSLFSLVFAVFAAWCRSTWRREKSWLLTRYSTRKLVSLADWRFAFGMTQESVQATPKEVEWKRVDSPVTFPFKNLAAAHLQRTKSSCRLDQFLVAQQ